ncbi:MAG: hypothetical protein OXL68_05480 [Paracoccaceae bacterium]|nr:hypothetical protein [Paracoccaceae bacterium]
MTGNIRRNRAGRVAAGLLVLLLTVGAACGKKGPLEPYPEPQGTMEATDAAGPADAVDRLVAA